MPQKPPKPIDIASLLQDGFSEETARELYAQGEEIAVFVMMQLALLAKKAAEVNGTHPSEPSGSVAPYLKEPRKTQQKRPGAKEGHKGSRRPPPEKITRHVKHVAECCPDCGGPIYNRQLEAAKFDTKKVYRGHSEGYYAFVKF